MRECGTRYNGELHNATLTKYWYVPRVAPKRSFWRLSSGFVMVWMKSSGKYQKLERYLRSHQ